MKCLIDMPRWFRRFILVGLLAWAGLGQGGCNSRGEYTGLRGLVDDLIPMSPRQAASDAFNPYDPDTRRRAINLLSNAPFGGESAYLRTYRLLVSDGDPTVRAACVAALGRHGTVEDVPLILIYLKDDARIVRWEAAKALQRIHHPDAVAPLLSRLDEDPSADVRQAAANALGQYRQRKVFDALVGALNDDDYAVVVEAGNALATLTGQDFKTDGAKWLTWAKGKDNVQLFAGARPYYYPRYDKPPSWWQRAQFWKDHSPPPPQSPRGFEGEGA